MTVYEETSLRLLTQILAGLNFQVAGLNPAMKGNEDFISNVLKWQESAVETISHVSAVINEEASKQTTAAGNEGAHG